MVFRPPDSGVLGVLKVCPKTSVNEISDDLNPVVLRFARLLPTTLNPWLFVAKPDNPVEKVVRPMIAPYAP
jgi:hypothetical protein